jgi:predicted transcriptional regulator
MGNPLHHQAVLDVLRDAPAPLTVEDIAFAAFITEDEVLNSLSVLVPSGLVRKVATKYGDYRYVTNR